MACRRIFLSSSSRSWRLLWSGVAPILVVALALLLHALGGVVAAPPRVLETFDDPGGAHAAGGWGIFSRLDAVLTDAARAHSPPRCALWNDTLGTTQLRTFALNDSLVPLDWTPWSHLEFWAASLGPATGAVVTLVVSSENASVPGIDYFHFAFPVDWTGGTWRRFLLARDHDFRVARAPLGWHAISHFLFSSTWAGAPAAATALLLDDLRLVSPTFEALSPDGAATLVPGHAPATVAFPLWVRNLLPSAPAALEIRGGATTGLPAGVSATLLDTGIVPAPSGNFSTFRGVAVPAGAVYACRVLFAAAPGTAPTGAGAPLRFEVAFAHPASGEVTPPATFELHVRDAPSPLGRAKPNLLLSGAELDAVLVRAGSDAETADAVARVLATAARALAGDDPMDVPLTGGRWGGYYVCDDGGGLSFDPANSSAFYCASERRTYLAAGDPERAGAWVTRKHSYVLARVRDLGLAYWWTRNASFAELAIATLETYATRYPGWPLHSVGQSATLVLGPPSRSGARIYDQTLDEAAAAAGSVALAFDLLHGAMTAAQRTHVEFNLLRGLVDTVDNHDAGLSNWQSWHNAAFVLLGKVLEDDALVSATIAGTPPVASGALWQVEFAMLDDGMWFEGSIGYHFFTLDAFVLLASAAESLGYDVWNHAVPRNDAGGTKTLFAMFTAPVLLLLPDDSFPALNDMGAGADLRDERGTYEVAYRLHAGDPAVRYALHAVGRTSALTTTLLSRGAAAGLPRNASQPQPALPSVNFAATGYVILRSGRHTYAALDYGPDDLWHSHYDSAELLLYAAGAGQLLDPGTVSYGLDLHKEFFKLTASHSTVLVNREVQLAAAGWLAAFAPGRLLSISSGRLSAADVGVTRTVLQLLGPSASERHGFVLDVVFPVAAPANSSLAVPANLTCVYHSHAPTAALVDRATGAPLAGAALGSGAAAHAALGYDGRAATVSWTYFSAVDEYAAAALSAPFDVVWERGRQATADFERPRSDAEWAGGGVRAAAPAGGTGFSLLWERHDRAGASYVQWENALTNWSGAAGFQFALYSAVANGAGISLILRSENDTVPGMDYYYAELFLNFTGWRAFRFDFGANLTEARDPVGVEAISYVQFNAAGWGNTPQTSSRVWLDDVTIVDAAGSPLPASQAGLRLLGGGGGGGGGATRAFLAKAPDPASREHPAFVEHFDFDRPLGGGGAGAFVPPLVHLLHAYAEAPAPELRRFEWSAQEEGPDEVQLAFRLERAAGQDVNGSARFDARRELVCYSERRADGVFEVLACRASVGRRCAPAPDPPLCLEAAGGGANSSSTAAFSAALHVDAAVLNASSLSVPLLASEAPFAVVVNVTSARPLVAARAWVDGVLVDAAQVALTPLGALGATEVRVGVVTSAASFATLRIDWTASGFTTSSSAVDLVSSASRQQQQPVWWAM